MNEYYNQSIAITELRPGECQCDPKYTGAKYAVSVDSCTNALFLCCL